MTRPDLIICGGIDRLYAVAEVTPAGRTERLSEHDTAEQALDAKDHALAAAADALVGLAEIGRARA